MRYIVRIGRDPCELPVAAGTLREVAERYGVLKNTVRQQICKGRSGEFRQSYDWVVFDDDMGREIMAEEAMDLVRLRMESEMRKAEQTKGTPREFTYRHTANILRGILLDLEDFTKETRNASHKRK